MPLFLVRGPGWGALIRADDQDDALYVLDSVADPTLCEVVEYEGPLALEFSLPAVVTRDPRGGTNLVVPESPVPINVNHLPFIDVLEGEFGGEMRQAILREGFPSLFELWEGWDENPERDEEVWGEAEGLEDKGMIASALAEEAGWSRSYRREYRLPPDQEREQERVRECRSQLLVEQLRENLKCRWLDRARDVALELLKSLEDEIAKDEERARCRKSEALEGAE